MVGVRENSACIKPIVPERTAVSKPNNHPPSAATRQITVRYRPWPCWCVSPRAGATVLDGVAIRIFRVGLACSGRARPRRWLFGAYRRRPPSSGCLLYCGFHYLPRWPGRLEYRMLERAGRLAQLVRAPCLHRGCRGFESLTAQFPMTGYRRPGTNTTRTCRTLDGVAPG